MSHIFLPFEPAAHAAGLHFLRNGAEHGRLPPLLGDLAVLPCGVMRSMPPPRSLSLVASARRWEAWRTGGAGRVAAKGRSGLCWSPSVPLSRPVVAVWGHLAIMRTHGRAGGLALASTAILVDFRKNEYLQDLDGREATVAAHLRRLQAVARAAMRLIPFTACIL